MSVRTARLAAGVTGPASVTVVVYTCPSGRTAIVKDLRVASLVNSSVSTIIAIESGPSTSNLFVGPNAAFNVIIERNAFIVLEPGDRLVLNVAAAGGASYYVSGAELAGVAP